VSICAVSIFLAEMASEAQQQQQQHVENRKAYPNTAEAYQLIEPIGQGESAVVYRAWCESLQEQVAIKIVDLELFQTSLEEISKEIQVMSLSQHPNVVPYCTSFVCGHDLWVVMPLLAGGDVKSLMDCSFPEGMDEPLVQYILCGVLRAIAYFHENGQIHRNIKAANILLTVDGRVMLSDYGLVGWMVEGGLKRSIRQTFVGTPCWMAPEVLEQTHGYDYKADIWSFGITALELAQGRAPYSEYPPMKVLLLTLQGPAPSLKGPARQRFSKAFHDLVSQCLCKDPSQRPTAFQLLEHKFFKNVKKPSNLAEIIAKSPPLGRRSGNQRLLVQQVRNSDTQHYSKNGEDNCEVSTGWNFGEDEDDDDNKLAEKKKEDTSKESLEEVAEEDKQSSLNKMISSNRNESIEKPPQSSNNKWTFTQDNNNNASHYHSDEDPKVLVQDSTGTTNEDKNNAKTMMKKGRFVVIEVDDHQPPPPPPPPPSSSSSADHPRATSAISNNNLPSSSFEGGGGIGSSVAVGSGKTTTTPSPRIEEQTSPSKESHAQPSNITGTEVTLPFREHSRSTNALSSWNLHSTENSKSFSSFRRGRFEVKEVEDNSATTLPSSNSRSRPQSPSPRTGALVGGSGSGGGGDGTKGPLTLLAELQTQLIALLNENENLRKENATLKLELEKKQQ